jgi:aspartyl-tRNA(Asn)/glutamyl-tRNA(Gln) amidotransferase subunit B
VANWVTGELFAIARSEGNFENIGIRPEHLAEIVHMVQQGEINQLTGKEVLALTRASGQAPRAIVAERGLAQVSDESLMQDVVARVIATHEAAVSDYRNGKKAAIGFLLGQAMREMKGTGNPDALRRILVQHLDSES